MVDLPPELHLAHHLVDALGALLARGVGRQPQHCGVRQALPVAGQTLAHGQLGVLDVPLRHQPSSNDIPSRAACRRG